PRERICRPRIALDPEDGVRGSDEGHLATLDLDGGVIECLHEIVRQEPRLIRPCDAVYRCTEQPIDAGIQERPGTLIGIEQSPKSEAGIRPVRKTNGLAERDLERVADACRTVVIEEVVSIESILGQVVGL